MIKRESIIGVLIDFGLSVIECERALENKENFRLTIRDIIDQHIREYRENLGKEL